jgi:hypothetical protein
MTKDGGRDEGMEGAGGEEEDGLEGHGKEGQPQTSGQRRGGVLIYD